MQAASMTVQHITGYYSVAYTAYLLISQKAIFPSINIL